MTTLNQKIDSVIMTTNNNIMNAQTDTLNKIMQLTRQGGSRESLVTEIEKIQNQLNAYIADQYKMLEKQIDVISASFPSEE